MPEIVSDLRVHLWNIGARYIRYVTWYAARYVRYVIWYAARYVTEISVKVIPFK